MKTNTFNKLLSLLSIGVLMLSMVASPVGAQSFVQTSGTTGASSYPYQYQQNPYQPNQSCLVLTRGLAYGSRDGYGYNDVSRLQSFLISQGYLYSNVTGYYGSLTASAVAKFQQNNNLSPVGIVGPATRARIQQLTCNGGGVIPPSTQAPVITSMNPTYGPTGTYVTIYGSGFSSNNTIKFGNGGITNVPSYNGTSVQFRIPESMGVFCQSGQYCIALAIIVNPGNYAVSVVNDRGTSNSQTFTVTSGNSGNPYQPYGAPVINGIDAPTTLGVNQTGTWTVRATDQAGGGLNYSVDWGDQYYPYTSAAASQTFIQSSTFTHAYSQPGVYTVRFTVRGSNGLTTTSSVTVNVTSSGNNPYGAPYITSITPSYGPYGTVVTIRGNNFARFDNAINYAGVSRVLTGQASSDGSTLQFTIPATPCAQGYYCAQNVLPPGNYPISVTTSNGTSNNVYFNLTSGSTNTDQYITLSVGQTGTVNNVQIRPEAIREDSRCSAGVYCIQAGRVVVTTNLRGPSSSLSPDLQYGGSGNTSVNIDGYTVQITDVQPMKYQTGTIYTSDYRITYRVTR